MNIVELKLKWFVFLLNNDWLILNYNYDINDVDFFIFFVYFLMYWLKWNNEEYCFIYERKKYW